uniref:Uncharacterized protein ycf20 n=1 Tax=Antithamnion hubbsii TaxID=1005974 RepID=A0A4D6WL86_9FLOR|nr:hypothetical protein [Antithamnion hubbsii]
MLKFIQQILTYKFNDLSLQFVSLLLGFYLSTILSTIPAQTGDWSIISASIIVTSNEIISRFIYQNKKQAKFITVYLINSIKIGIIYGLFVDAFKLGS